MSDNGNRPPAPRAPLGAALCAFLFFFLLGFPLSHGAWASGDKNAPLSLEELIAESLEKNPGLLAFESRIAAAEARVPQAKSLPDPMFMLGYQNEGWERYTYGEMPDAQWMFSASQMFPFPGKLRLKGLMAERDAESLKAFYESLRLENTSRIKGLYHDLLFGHKESDIINEKKALFLRVEEAALARYSSGMGGSQQEVIMAQGEKYMLLEREAMVAQRIEAVEAMLNAAVGRDTGASLGRPAEAFSPAPPPLDEILKGFSLIEDAPRLKAKKRMVAAAEARLQMARREFYPDFTVTGGVSKRKGEFEDMWSLSTAVNIPLYHKTKQRQAVKEAEAMLSEANRELEAEKYMLSSSIRENYSMLESARKLMELYRDALIPKARQEFEAALSGYAAGRGEAVGVIGRLRALLDLEILYWGQAAAREKAIAMIEAITGGGAHR